MSDTKLRDLERRWKETGTVEDEAAYLLERVRVGDLTQERLELAAYCGHEGATRVVGPVDRFEEDVGFWAQETVRYGHYPPVLAAVVAAELALPTWARLVTHDSRPGDAVRMARAWVLSPKQSEQISREAELLMDAVDEAVELVVDAAAQKAGRAAMAATHAVHCAAGQPYAGATNLIAGKASSAARAAAALVGERLTRATVERELMSWSLRYQRSQVT